jgi:oligoribonuclease
MQYVSIDIETLGLDPEKHDIVEFAAVVDNLRDRKPIEQLPTFHRFVYNESDLYHGSSYAMAMHHRIFEKLKDREKEFIQVQKSKFGLPSSAPSDYSTKGMLLLSFQNFLIDHGYKADGRGIVRVQVAGKNFSSFDKRFLEEQCFLGHRLMNMEERLEFGHRVLDPGMLYFDPRTDDAVPSMSECLKRAGMNDFVAHTAYDDAIAVIQLLRKKL